jgi:choline dehydrogenase-like flavoprotein
METTDYLVVGAGSAGAALARRLAEAGAGVLVLEAGIDWGADGALDERLRHATGLFNFDAYNILPDYYWQGLEMRARPERAPARYLRGRGGGGSSLVNGCYAIRPPIEEFDGWAASGCAGWSAAEVAPYFNRLENDADYGHHPHHGDTGPLPVRRFEASGWGTMDRAFAAAAQESGLAWADDHNAPGTLGVSPFAANILDGIRISTGEAYLEPGRATGRLAIHGGVLVDKVLFEGNSAVGVRAIVNGQVREYRAEHVVLSAGTPLSPGILQRSGIGPAGVLSALGIKTLVDLPVGEAVQDHQGMLLGLGLKGEARSSDAGQRSNVMARWSTGMEDTGAGDVMACGINISPTPEVPGSRPASLLGVLNQVFSRGTVHITSADPLAPARLEMDFLSDERDLSRFRELYRTLAGFLDQPSLRNIVERVHDSNGQDLDIGLKGGALDARLLSLVQDTAHAAGSCKMGSADDPATVVDAECRVLGLEGLRVVDASIMPSVTRANTNLAVIMIGERAADLILGSPSPAASPASALASS